MKRPLISLVTIAGVAGLLTGCATRPPAKNAHNVVTQFSTYDALYHALYDGGMTLGDLERHGDFGLGTLDGWDGEVVILNGRVYQILGDGTVKVVTDRSATTPFLEVTHFHSGLTNALSAGTTYRDLQKEPDNFLPTQNAIFAVKIEGAFRHVKTRSMPKQTKPYKGMAELVKTQPTFEFENVRGTMVGFWSPPSMRGVALAGWHLHFLTADHRAGGHVLEFTTDDAAMSLEESRRFHWLIPGSAAYEREDFSAK